MYREVTMFEVKEVLRLWLSGTPKKRIAAQLGLDPKTVRHYVAVGTGSGLPLGAVLTEEHIREVLLALRAGDGVGRGSCPASRSSRWCSLRVRPGGVIRFVNPTGCTGPLFGTR